MDEVNTPNSHHENAWSGAICGWLLLGLFTLGTCRWMQGAKFDGQAWLITNLAWSNRRSGQRQRAGRIYAWGGGAVLIAALVCFQLGNSRALTAAQNFQNGFSWLDGTLVWSGVMLLVGIGMYWRADRR